MTNMKITLTAEQYEELEKLEPGQHLELSYHGIYCWIEPVASDDDLAFFNATYKGRNYLFNFYCPSTVIVSVKRGREKEEAKGMKETTFMGAEFDPYKMHVYDVKTKGKHPVHLIEGGTYITEDKRDFEAGGDMGWFWLNEKEYQYYKSMEHEITILE